jgi:hypothetical protein
MKCNQSNDVGLVAVEESQQDRGIELSKRTLERGRIHICDSNQVLFDAAGQFSNCGEVNILPQSPR